MINISKTFKKPYYIVTFISTLNDVDDSFDKANIAMIELAPKQAGFLGMDRGRTTDGLGFSISYWESLEAIESWRENMIHKNIQKNARKQWLSKYTLRTSKVEYDFHFDIENINEPTFSIEDQAVLYGLISTEIHAIDKEKASTICKSIVKLMANERGNRMAQRCLKDGNELSIRNFLLYSEWDNQNLDNVYEPVSFKPGYSLNVTKCGWHSAWKKHNMSHHGVEYCSVIDIELMNGFNPDIIFTVSQYLTENKSFCDFRWTEKVFSDKEDLLVFNKERAKITERVVKNFLYHSAHLYSCAERTLTDIYGIDKSKKVLNNAMSKYKKEFSTQKCDLIIQEKEKDFSLINV